MKFFGFALVSLFAVSSFAVGMSSEQINQGCLDILVKNAATASVDINSDISSGEKLSDILALLKNPNIAVSNICNKISYDGIYQCQLIMSAKVGEVGIDYAVFVGADGVTPADEVLPNVYVSRGH